MRYLNIIKFSPSTYINSIIASAYFFYISTTLLSAIEQSSSLQEYNTIAGKRMMLRYNKKTLIPGKTLTQAMRVIYIEIAGLKNNLYETATTSDLSKIHILGCFSKTPPVCCVKTFSVYVPAVNPGIMAISVDGLF